MAKRLGDDNPYPYPGFKVTTDFNKKLHVATAVAGRKARFESLAEADGLLMQDTLLAIRDVETIGLRMDQVTYDFLNIDRRYLLTRSIVAQYEVRNKIGIKLDYDGNLTRNIRGLEYAVQENKDSLTLMTARLARSKALQARCMESLLLTLDKLSKNVDVLGKTSKNFMDNLVMGMNLPEDKENVNVGASAAPKLNPEKEMIKNCENGVTTITGHLTSRSVAIADLQKCLEPVELEGIDYKGLAEEEEMKYRAHLKELEEIYNKKIHPNTPEPEEIDDAATDTEDEPEVDDAATETEDTKPATPAPKQTPVWQKNKNNKKKKNKNQKF